MSGGSTCGEEEEEGKEGRRRKRTVKFSAKGVRYKGSIHRIPYIFSVHRFR
jgi:hypothetical protein